MTTGFEVPQSVRDNQQKRALASGRPQPCGEGTGDGLTCREFPTRLYRTGWRCEGHPPLPVNPVPDPARTVDGLRANCAHTQAPTKGSADEGVTAQGEADRQAAALSVRDGADSHDVGPVTNEGQPATEKGGPGEPPARVLPLTGDTLTDRFRAFHDSNPHVMDRLVQLVTQHVDHGATRLGIGALFEELRGDVETNGNRYRLDNSLRSLYVRALVADRPAWEHLFETRQRRSA